MHAFAEALAEAQNVPPTRANTDPVVADAQVQPEPVEVVNVVNASQGDISVTPNLVDAVQQVAEEVKKPVRRTRKPRV